ncbi:Protein RTM1 [Paramyrothecium foliicola]|nr:Protein RTM1 [Paramyrothecium foliicola]
MSGPKPYKSGYYLWKFVPNRGLAITTGILFLLASSAHGWRLYRTRLWFCIPMVVGGIMEAAGYFARAKASGATDRLMPYVIQNVLILLPPILFAASIYMILGRLINALSGERYSLVPLKWMTKIFLAGDIVSFLVQGGASGLMATGNNAKLGEYIVIGGLMIQIIVFGFFLFTAGVFHYRFDRKAPLATTSTWASAEKTMYMLHAVSALIMVRSIFRVAEFAMGHDGYLLTHEWTLYVFDTILMLAVMVIYFIRWPSWINDTTMRINSEEGLANVGVNLATWRSSKG